EWPSLRALLGDVRGLRIVDLGCGYGWFCRWASDAGAQRIVGLDVSSRMLAVARAQNSGSVITYKRADLGQLSLPPAPFDLAFSSLALHYVSDFAAVVLCTPASSRAGALSSPSNILSTWRPARQSGLWMLLVGQAGRSMGIRAKGPARPTGSQMASSSSIAPLPARSTP